jgi:hypothetical protein
MCEGDALQELSERSAFINSVDPKDIKENNTGRLAAKFVMSFFPNEN